MEGLGDRGRPCRGGSPGRPGDLTARAAVPAPIPGIIEPSGGDAHPAHVFPESSDTLVSIVTDVEDGVVAFQSTRDAVAVPPEISNTGDVR